MNFYEIGVSSAKYHGSNSLTYAWPDKLSTGTVVEVPLREGRSLGVVLRNGGSHPKISIKQLSAVHGDVKLPSAQLQLLAWLRKYYPAPLSTIVQLFLPSAVTSSNSNQKSTQTTTSLPGLTSEQQHAIKLLSKTPGQAALLHGDTGVGKTRVYLELARKVLAKGQSVIVLVPEIGLTPQMIAFFESQFPNQVRSINSGRTDKQRRETWWQIQQSLEPQIVIGPRSALFAPLENIGLIVIDEAHDKGYKQDKLPYYDATRVAAKLASISGALCLYGTATPRVADYWHLSRHNTPIVRMSQQIHKDIKTPEHLIVDSGERKNFDRSSIFSESMLQSIAESMARNEQVLVFLNRRGTARFVSCSVCGWHAACTNCDTPLTYHGDKHQIQCHTCGITKPVPTACPNCQSPELRYQRRGTKALQSELEKLFPSARIGRFDSDNTRTETLASQYQNVADSNIDIIIGTQVIAKGLDLAHLSLVCVPQADTSAYLPDYTADEQTFQLLKQVIGRVGRTNKPSRVIIQTYLPNSPIIRAAVDNNWQKFYDQQLVHRKKYNFPPFAYLLQLTTIKATPASAQRSAQKLKDNIQNVNKKCEVLGPAPRFHEKIGGKYQWQLVVKSSKRQDLLDIIATLPSGWRYNIDPSDLL